MFNPHNYKRDFPIFSQSFNGKQLVYLDNAATTQKPSQVINAVSEFYEKYNASIARSSHFLSDVATRMVEESRDAIARFIGGKADEIVFTLNATQSLNLAIFSWGMQHLSEGDVILTSISEHNSSLLPVKALSKSKSTRIEYFDIDDQGLLASNWRQKFSERVKLVVINHVSNVFGTVMPLKEICSEAKKVGAVVVVDGSQAVGHLPVDVMSVGCDFYAFSAHKVYGPTGVGVLWGKKDILNNMLPLYYGGGMVVDNEISFQDLKEVPFRFEAGSINSADIVGARAAIDYMNNIDIQSYIEHCQSLFKQLISSLQTINGMHILGPFDSKKLPMRSGLVSFYIDGIHSHDIASVLSSEGIAVRSGLHCAMNLYKELELPSATRISLGLYNTKEDIDAVVGGIEKAFSILK